MNRKEKIDYIYEKIADKKIKYGCIVFDSQKNIKFEIIRADKKTEDEKYNYGIDISGVCSELNLLNLKVIGSPVRFGDCLEYFKGKYFNDLYNFWKKIRLPIDNQSDECIDFLYDLIKINEYEK